MSTRKRTKENFKSSKKKDGRREQSGLGKIGNKELHYVVKLNSDEENSKSSTNKDKHKHAKKKNNKRRSLSVLVPNYKKDIVNNIKLADKLYKLTANKSSDESEEDDRRKRKHSKRDKKNDWKSKKNKHRRSLTCGSYHSDSEHSVDSAQKNKKVDININEVQTKYKNKNIKIIYDDGYSKKIVVRGDRRRAARSDGEDEHEGESDDRSDDGSDDGSDDRSDSQSDDGSDSQSDDQSDTQSDDESERRCRSQAENHSNDYTRPGRRKKGSGRRKRKEESKPAKRKKKKCAKRHSTTLSDSYCEEKRKKNIKKGKRKFSTQKFVGARSRKESSEPIDRNYRADKYHGPRAKREFYPSMYERGHSEDRSESKNECKNEYKNVHINKYAYQNKSPFEEAEAFNPCSDRGRKTMAYQSLSTRSDQVKNDFFLTIKDIIFKLHLNLQNIKEILKNKNDYITSLLDSSYRNILQNVKRNAIKQDNFYRVIFHDLFNLLNEFILVDDYTKKFFFSIETDVRQRCLENIKNEFYIFINRYLPSGERRSVYSPSRGANELSPPDMYKRIMDMHESANKRKSLYSALASYNNGGGPTGSSMLGSGLIGSGMIGSGNPASFFPGEYQAHPDVQSILHLNSLQQIEGGRSELAKIDGMGNDLALKVKNASEQEDAVNYLKGVVKAEKEKNIKLELQYDELKQKYDLLKKKREEDVSKEVNMSKSNADEEDNFFKKFYQSQSFIKLEEKKLEDSSKRIIDENVRLTRMKEMNENSKREIEKDMLDMEVKRKEIEKDKDDMEIKKKEIELANEEISKQNKQLEEEKDMLNRRKKELEEESSLLDNTKREVDEQNDLLKERKRELDELNKLLEEKQNRVEEADNALRKKQKEVQDTDVLLNEKQSTMQRRCTLLERESLNRMGEEGDALEERSNQLERGSTQMKANETEHGTHNNDPNQQHGSGDDPHKGGNEESNAFYTQNDNPSYTPSGGTIPDKHNTLALERSSPRIVENEANRNDMNIDGDAKRSSVLSYLGSTKFSLKDASKRGSNMSPIGGTPQNGQLVLNDKNLLMMKNQIVEREKALLSREEKLNEEKEQIAQQMNQLNILQDDISSKTEALHIREEELKRKELHLLGMQQGGEGTQRVGQPNVASNKTNSLFCNAEEMNSSGENSKQQFEPANCINDSNEGAANNQMGHAGIAQPEGDHKGTNQPQDEAELNESLQKGDSTHLEGTNSSQGKNTSDSTSIPCGASPSAGDNLEAIKSNLNNCLDEIAKYKLLLKSRDAEICSLKTQLGMQQGGANWNGDATQEGNSSGDNSKMGDALCNTGNAAGGVNGRTGFSSLSGDLKQPIGFSGPAPGEIKPNSEGTELNAQKTMKSVISSELITLYKEISKIKEEYNKSILKKNEFIGGLLHNFFNEMRNNYKLKENFYQKESSKYHALISDKECYINELKNALQEKKAKEVSYKKMLLKMNQINDAYKLKNKRSLSTVEMLKQDIKLLNQDVLKKKEMFQKMSLNQDDYSSKKEDHVEEKIIQKRKKFKKKKKKRKVKVKVDGKPKNTFYKPKKGKFTRG